MIYLENTTAILTFDPECKGELCSVFNKITQTEFFVAKSDEKEKPLWHIDLKNKNGRILTIDSSQAKLFQYEFKKEQDSLILQWENVFPDGTLGYIEAVISRDNASNLFELGFTVKLDSKDYGIWHVAFPDMHGIGKTRQSLDYLTIPYQLGRLISNPIEKIFSSETQKSSWKEKEDIGTWDWVDWNGFEGNKIEGDYPCMWTMQWNAYYGDSIGGLYLATHDPEAYYKRFRFYNPTGGKYFNFVLSHFPEDMGYEKKKYKIPYPVNIGCFKGDWITSAKMYRTWAVKQKWCGKRLLAKRQDIPEWVKKEGLWYINLKFPRRGTVPEIVDTMSGLKKTTRMNFIIQWYEWQPGRAADTHLPDYFLHGEDAEKVKDGLQQLHREGMRAIPYINGRVWTKEETNWITENASAIAVKDPAGNILPEWWWGDEFPGRTIVPICPATSQWHEKITHCCSEIIGNYGFDGVYIDQIGSFHARMCFDKNHKHPLGGGKYWTEGYRKLLERVRQKIHTINPESIMTTESCCEAYMDYFDGHLVLDVNWPERTESVPLFAAVYHDYTILYGGYTHITQPDESPREFLLGNGSRFVWGIQLMLPDIKREDFLEEHFYINRQFIKALLSFSQMAVLQLQFTKYFIEGEWIAPIRILDNSGNKSESTITGSFQASDNSICVAIVNISEEKQDVYLNIPQDLHHKKFQIFGFSLDRTKPFRGVEVIEEDEIKPLILKEGKFSEFNDNIELNPRAVVVVIFS